MKRMENKIDCNKTNKNFQIKRFFIFNVFKSTKFFLVFAVVFLLSSEAFSSPKIGIVNTRKIFGAYNKTKMENRRLKKQAEKFKKRLNKLNKKKDRIRREYNKLVDKAENFTYSDDVREKSRIKAKNKQKQLSAKESEIKRLRERKQKEFYRKYQRTRQKIVNDINKVIKSYAKRKNFDLIFDSSGLSSNKMPIVMYNDDSLNITQKIIKDMNMGTENKN